MSQAEITEFVERCTEDERAFLWRTLVASFAPKDELHVSSIDQRFREMETGKQTPWSEIREQLMVREAQEEEP